MPIINETTLAEAIGIGDDDDDFDVVMELGEGQVDENAIEILSVEDVPLNLNLAMDEDYVIEDVTGIKFFLNKKGYREACGKNPPDKKKVNIHPLIGLCQCCRSEIRDDGKTTFFAYGRPAGSLVRQKYFCKKCIPATCKCQGCKYNFTASELKFGFCPTCVQNAHSRLILPYSTKAQEKFKKLGTCLDKIYFGVELEYESKDYGLDTLIVNDLIKEFAILKRDSSIKQGFEVVTTPATMDEHRNRLWENFTNSLPPTVVVEESCGMHVHVSRVRMTSLQIGKILNFMHNPHNRQFIAVIAGRPSSFHNDFTKPKRVTDGRDGGRRQKDMDRHTAVNCNGQQTLEFRIFRSTKDKHILIKNIEFCYALVKFQQAGNVGIKESALFDNFYKFVFEFRKDYPELWKFLTSRSEYAMLRKK